MKTFIVVNGKHLRIIERETMDQAKEFAVNFMDHSKEIIVREIETITDHTKVYVNQE